MITILCLYRWDNVPSHSEYHKAQCSFKRQLCMGNIDSNSASICPTRFHDKPGVYSPITYLTSRNQLSPSNHMFHKANSNSYQCLYSSAIVESSLNMYVNLYGICHMQSKMAGGLAREFFVVSQHKVLPWKAMTPRWNPWAVPPQMMMMRTGSWRK